MNKLKRLFYNFLPFLLGGLASLSFAPTYFVFFLFLSFPALLFLIRKSNSLKESFYIGWLFGFGFFLFGLYWISYALLVDEDLFGWLVPFAVTLIPAILALYIGVLTTLVHKLRKNTYMLTTSFIALWVLFEIIRTTLFTGFPWLALGYSLSNYISLIQSASLFGVFGLSFLLLLIITTPFILLSECKNNNPSTLIYVFCCFLIFTLNFSYGKWILKNAKREFLPYSVRVVQPNIAQSIKWDKYYRYLNLQKTIDLSRSGSKEVQTYIIWPEATVLYSMNDKSTRDLIKTIIPENSYLITGGIRDKKNPTQYWTSLFMLNHDGEIVDHYDKMHLVPFGEYIPFRDILPFSIKKITHGFLDYNNGTNAKIIKPPNGMPSFRGLICYESFFAQELLVDAQRPDFLLNITNDAWYRDSPGPYQHFDITKFRAIEYGIPMIRSANTGISAIISPYGEILQQLPLNKEGFIISQLPKQRKNKTLYNLYGNTPLFILLIVVSICTYALFNNKRITNI